MGWSQYLVSREHIDNWHIARALSALDVGYTAQIWGWSSECDITPCDIIVNPQLQLPKEMQFLPELGFGFLTRFSGAFYSEDSKLPLRLNLQLVARFGISPLVLSRKHA